MKNANEYLLLVKRKSSKLKNHKYVKYEIGEKADSKVTYLLPGASSKTSSLDQKSGLQEGASAGQKQSRDHQAVLYTNTAWQRFWGTAIFIVEKQYSKISYWEQTKV